MADLPLPPAPTLAIAVSGGADSMALLLLADAWAHERGGHVIALTVDHGLRKESAEEARRVHQWCRDRNIEPHTLHVRELGLRIEGTGIQAQARDARYRLLTQWCKSHAVPHLLTAHHQGDQAETLFFRLARGSGLDGLACMQPATDCDGISILRPLLSVPKERLVATLQQMRQQWIEDPSNRNLDYTRIRIRQAIASSGNAHDIQTRVYRITHALGKFRNKLNNNTASELTLCVSLGSDSAVIETKKFLSLEPEYGLRVLAAVTQHIGRKEHKPRTQTLERFWRQLCRDIGEKKNTRRTLSRCLFHLQPKQGRILVSAEKARH